MADDATDPRHRVHTIVHGNASLAVEDRGEGSAVLCLHAGVCDRRMWRGHDPARWGRRLVAYDRRGFGETSASPEDHDPVADAVAILDALGLERVIALGCSQGGRLALALSLAHPQRVSALVLVAPAVGGAPEPELDPPTAALAAAIEQCEARGDIEALAALETRVWLDGPTAPEGRVGGAARALVLEMTTRVLRAGPVGDVSWPADTWARLGEISAPALVVWGELDVPFVRAQSRAVASLLAGGKGVELAGVAHLPSLEAPELLDREVLAFLHARGL